MPQSGDYDTMQVCLDGHVATDRYYDYPARREKYCEECGTETITECLECNKEIQGALRNIAIRGTKDPPPNCRNCGEAFPWNNAVSEFANVNDSELDEELRNRCISQYENGAYQSAVQHAFTVLEDRVRTLGGFTANDSGASLMTDALHPDDGPLAFGKTGGEKQGVMLLYKGAFQLLRNPTSHRIMDEIDESYARDALHTVNLLLQLLDENN